MDKDHWDKDEKLRAEAKEKAKELKDKFVETQSKEFYETYKQMAHDLDKWIVEQDQKYSANPIIMYDVLREAMLVREWKLKYIFNVPDYVVRVAKDMTDETSAIITKEGYGTFAENSKYDEFLRSIFVDDDTEKEV
jgi:arginyl-tRNA synthetase